MKELEECYEFTKAQLAELKQLRQRVAELEELSVTRILVDVVAGDGSGHEVYAKSVEDVKRLLSELSEKAEDFDLETVPLRKQLAASQLENKRLRSALDKASYQLIECERVAAYETIIEAISTPTDTEALEKYLADRLGEPVGYFEQEYVGGPVLFYQVNYSEKDTPGVIPLFALKEKT